MGRDRTRIERLEQLNNSSTVSDVTGTAPIVVTTPAVGVRNVAVTGLSGTNTGDQTITLTGDVTGSGTGSFAATIGNSKVTNAKLANMAAHTVKANITGSSAAPVDSSLSAILDAELSSTQGTILYRDASAWAALATGTSGQALVTQGAAANPHWASVGGGSGGAMTYINTATVTGSANSTITISGLSLAADQSYYGQFALLDATGLTPVMNLLFNGDTTGTNYWRQNTLSINASISTTRANNPNIIQFTANKQICGEFWVIKDFNGAAKARITCMGGDYSLTTLVDSQLNWVTVTDVTSIALNSSGTNGFAVGSFLKLWSIHS